MANESTTWLYEQLTNKGYNVGKDVNEFDSLMHANAQSRQWAYETATNCGFNVGKDIDEFTSLVVGRQQPTQPSQDEQPQANPATAPTPGAEATPAADANTAPSRPRYYKLRRGGRDFTVPEEEVEAAGGLTAWWNKAVEDGKAGQPMGMNLNAPYRVYMHGKDKDGNDFDGHVAMSVADERRAAGYDYTFTDTHTDRKPTLADRKRSAAQLANVAGHNEKVMDESKEWMEDMQEYSESSTLTPKPVESSLELDPNTGKASRTYLTHGGRRMKDKDAAEWEELKYRLAIADSDMSLAAQLRRAYEERDYLISKANARRAALTREDNTPGVLSSIMSSGDAITGATSATTSATSQRLFEDTEYQQYREAISEVNNRIQTLENRRYVDNGGDQGFWRTFGQTVSTPETWVGAMSTDFLSASARLSANTVDTSSAHALKKAIAETDEAEAEYGDFGFFSRAGSMTGYMLPFMLDFAVTGGGFEAINVAGRAATKGAAKLIGREAIQEMATMGVKAYAKQYGAKGVGRMAGNWTIKALGTTADELLIRAPLMTNTVQAGKTVSDIVDRKLGDVEVDEYGNYDFTNDKTWGSAVWQGEANAIIENYSEMFGTHLEGIMPALAKTFGGKRISGMLARANASSFGQVLGTTRKHFQRMGVSDYFGEVSEEYYGQLWRTMLNLDDAKNGSGENLLLDGQFHGDIWGGMALSMGMMGVGKYTMASAVYAEKKHQVSKADRLASEIFTPEKWEPLRDIIDNTTNADMGDLAEQVITDAELTDKEREAALDYMERSLNFRGYNLATTAQSRGAEQDPTEAQLSNSYLDGYNAGTSDEMADAQNMYERLRLRAQERFGLRGAIFMDHNPVEVISQMRQSGASEEDIQLALDFANAKALRDGMIRRVNDNIDEQIAQSDAKIDASINDKSGSIITVVKKSNDTPLYVVSGEINTVQNADGTWEIDVKNSDKDIVVRNSVTGELEFTTPKELYLRDMDDPERVKAAAAEAIRQQTAQSAADAMNGVRYYNVGDVVPIEYYGDNIEAKVHSFLPDGGIIVEHPEGALIKYSREDLQEFAHNADMSRVEEFERARQEERSAAREPQAAPQQKPKPQFKLNDEFTITYQGQPVRGSITGELDEEGKIEIYTEEPTINGQQVIRITPEELEMILESYNGEDLTEPSSEGEGEGGYGADNWRDSRPDDNYGYQRRADIATDRLIDAARQGDEEAAAILAEYGEEIGTPGVYRFARKEEVDALQRGKHYAGRNGNGKVDVTASDVPTSAASGEFRIKFKPDFDLYKVGNGRTRMKNAEEKDGWIMDGYDIADVESIEQLQPDGTYAEVWHADAQAESAATVGTVPPQAPARSRVPVDEQGHPKYDEVDPDTAWDAIVEEAEGDEAIAAEVVADILEDRKAELTAADKALTKAKESKPEKRKASDPQLTMAERIAAKRAAKESLDQAQAARDRAQAAVNRWTKIAESKQRRANERLNAEQAEARRRAEALAQEEARLRAEREEQARKEREALNGVPDWQLDTAADARARGYRRDGAKKVDRPEVMDNYAWGNRVQVKFGDGIIPEGYAVVIEAEQLQPSHLDGKRNPSHFLDEAQPKNRKDGASRAAADRIAREIRPEEITSSVTAFTGAPSINGRGEVIQGNNRGDALRRMYEGYPQSAEKYRQYLIDHAQDFGLTPEAISAFSHPVLVNMLDVTDDEAIHYGQYAAQDTESGGIERIKPKNAVQRMGNEVSTFAALLLRSADDEASFSQLVDDNGVEVLKWMSRKGFISDTQYGSAFDSNGNLSAEAANDLKAIMYQSIFTGGSTRLEETFNKMPAKAQRAILATAFRDNESPESERLLGELQQSVTAFGSLMGFEQFREAANPEAVAQAIAAWKRQTSFDDVSGEAYLPAEKFSQLAIALAALYKSATQKQIQSTFNSIYDLVQGTVESDLFGEADTTKHPLSEAVRRVMGIELAPASKPKAADHEGPASEIDDSKGQKEGDRTDYSERKSEQPKKNPKYDRTIPTTPEAQRSAIARIIDFAKNIKNRVERAVIGGITKRQAKDFGNIGIDIDDTWVHSFESSAVVHNQNQHGNPTEEERIGQIAITPEDYARIPEILETYDRITKSPNRSHSTGNEVIIYEKEFDDGYIYYLEEKRDKRKSLSFQTMYKKKKGTDSSDGLMPVASPSTPTAPSDNLSSISDRKVNDSATDKQEPGEKSSESTTPLMDKIAKGERLDYFPGILDKLCEELAITPETISEFGPSDEIYEAIGHSKEEIDAMSAEELEKLVPDVVQQIESGWRQALQELTDRIEQTPNADEKEQFEQQQDAIKQHGDTVIAVFVATLANLYGQKTAAEKSRENSRSAADDASGTTTNPSGNRLVTDERYAQLRERMRKKLGGQLNMGVDPEILAIGAEMAVYHIEKGARKFKAYASAMIADLGDAIRPYLKAFYNAVRDMPEAVEAGLVADMDSYDDVRKVDIANFDKTTTDAMATAAAVVAEEEAEKQKAEAEKILKKQRKERQNPDAESIEKQGDEDQDVPVTSEDSEASQEERVKYESELGSVIDEAWKHYSEFKDSDGFEPKKEALDKCYAILTPLSERIGSMSSAEVEAVVRDLNTFVERLPESDDGWTRYIADEFTDSVMRVLKLSDRIRAIEQEKAYNAALANADELPTGEPNKRKPKMSDFVAGKDARTPVLQGIYHDPAQKMAIATDAKLLVMSRKGYDASLAGKIMGAKGELYGTYPHVTRVIPHEDAVFAVAENVDFDELEGKARAAARADKNAQVAVVCPDGKSVLLTAERLQNFARAARMVGASELKMYQFGGGNAIMAEGPDGKVLAAGMAMDDIRTLSKVTLGATTASRSESAQQPSPPAANKGKKAASALGNNKKSANLEPENFELSTDDIDAIDDPEIAEEVKDGARDWLAGDRGAWAEMCYKTIKEYVRNTRNNRSGDSRDADKTQLAGADAETAGRGVRRGSKLTGTPNRGASDQDVAGGTDGVENGAGSSGSVSGTPSTDGVGEGASDAEQKPGRAGNRGRGSGTRGSRGDVRKPGRKNGSKENTSDDGRGPAGDNALSKGEETAQSLIDDGLATLRDIFKNPGMTEPGRLNDVTTLMAGLGVNAVRFLGATAKIACGLVLKGFYKFARWKAEMHKALDPLLHEYTDLTDEQIAEFILSAWDMKMSFRGERKKVSEWAAELEVEELRKLAQMSIEEKRKAQAAAEDTPVVVGNLDNIRETLPFLLPAQHEDVEKAERQFFSDEHADREHAYGKGYLFTNGTGTGKTYTGLGIVKRFLKQGKKRILIVTVNDTKISDWIRDAANLGITATQLADTKSKGSGVVVTQYANLRQNYALLEDEFDLIVYDESHKLMENQAGDVGSTATMHHMLANRDAQAVFERELEISELGKNRRAIKEEIEKLNELLRIANAPASVITQAQKDKLKNSGFRSTEAIEQAIKEASTKEEAYDQEFERRLNTLSQDEAAVHRAEEISRKTKTVFLSATPFNTPSSLDYAEGYIFTYPETKPGESRRDKRNKFLKDKFGKSYRRGNNGDMTRMPEGQISDPEGVEEQEIAYSDYLQDTLHTMSGRMLDSAYDYSRSFPRFEMPEAQLVNEAMSELSNGPLQEYFKKTLFDYNYSTAFWEIIKTSFAIPRIKEHIALGRRVVVFHRRKASNQNVDCPFATGLAEAKKSNNEMHRRAAELFAQKYADLLRWEQGLDYTYPHERILREFMTEEDKARYRRELQEWEKKCEEALRHNRKLPQKPKMKCGRVGVFNGDQTANEKQAAVDNFNNLDSEQDVIVVQVQSGKEGISLHDTDGKHQRVMISLALPQSPIEFIQAEGRIYRVGNQSDAIFEYPLLGIDRELYDFAVRINGRSQTSENLAMGGKSRGLRDSITRGALGSMPMPVSKEQGRGGKIVDSRKAQTATGFDHAMSNWKGWRQQEENLPYSERSIPDPLAVKLMEWGGIERGETVLVAYAGVGSAARYAPTSAKLIALESDSGKLARLAALLGGGGRKILGEPFMTDEENSEKSFSTVNKADVVIVKTRTGSAGQDIMGGEQKRSVADVRKAILHTEDSGRVIAIVPTADLQGSDGLLAAADQWKRFNGIMIRSIINLPVQVFGEATSIVILDRSSDKAIHEAQVAKGTQNMDVAEATDAEAVLSGMRELSAEKREIDRIAKAVKRCKAVMAPFLNSRLVSSSGFRGEKKTKDAYVNRNSVSVSFTQYIVPDEQEYYRGYNGLRISFNELSTPRELERVAKIWLKCREYADMSVEEFRGSRIGTYLKESQCEEAHDLLGHMCTLIEAATGKTPTQLENLAEGRVENQIKTDMSIREFEDIYKTLDSGSEEIDELAKRVFAVAAKIEGMQFRMATPEVFGGHNVMAHYAPGRNSIELNSDAFNSIRYTDAQKAQCILHETIHAVTCWAIAKYKNATEEERAAMGAVGEACADILNVYKAINNDAFRAILQTGSKRGDNAMYGLTNEYEMLAEMANPAFRQALKAKRLWRQLVNGIKKLFGIDVTETGEGETTAFEVLDRAICTILEDFDPALYNEYQSSPSLNIHNMQQSDITPEEAEDDVLYRPVTDQETLDRLNSEPTIKVYRAMQIIDGGLRPPMSAKVDGHLRPATEIGVWEEAEERPEMADESGHFKLDKGNGKSIRAAYNPYLHTSRSPINDQFSSAWNRPELVTVEVEIPASELSSGYHADKAKDSVGEKTWKSGPIGRALAKIGQARKVILSRWGRVLRIVPVEEVADAYAQRLNAHGIAVPFNTVPPNLRDALAARGVKIGPPEKGNAGDASMPSFERWLEEQEHMRMGDGHGPYTDMELADADDIYAKIFGKSRYSKKQKIEYAARKRRNMATAAQEVAEALHLDNVEIVTDASALEGKRAKAKGFYNKQTGKITIVIPNHQDAFDVKKTVFHEAVAHYGLRKLFGKHFDTFLDKVYERADEDIRRKIAALAAKNGWDFRTATEEYLASLAEDSGFADRVNARFMPDWWMKVKELFIQMLNKLGIHAFDNESLVLTDNELRYILWRSYRNLEEPGGHRSIIGVAEDVAMQSELKVGNYAESGVEAASVAEDADIANTTSFNNQLTRYISGVMPEQEIINLGNPQGVMRLFLPELPIVMRQRILSKANATKHNVDLKALADLPHNISNPIFVFQRDAKTIGVLTEIKDRDGKNVCVAIELKRTIQNGGAFLEVNDIRSIHGREVENIVLPILHNNTLRYANKEKGLAWLSSASYNYQQEITVQDLDSVAKIVNNFENPTVEDDELFRLGDFTPRDRAIARDYYNRMTSTGSYQFQEAVQDSMLGLKKLYKAIIGGTRIEDVDDFENAYTFENRMSSATKGQQHEYFIRYMQPLLREIGEIAGADKAKRRSLINYLMAKHGLERNEYMRRQAAENNENTDRDFAGLTGLTRTDNWQLAEETAQDWVDQYEAEHDTEPLWRAIRRATEASLQKIYLSGLLSKENYEKILGMYQYYIPLRGWDETTSDEVYGYLTSKDGPLGGSIVKKAKGRESVADDPIATIAMMADDAIRQGNRNIMKQRFLNFVLNHPSDLVSVHDLWLQFDEPSGEWQPIFPDINENDTPDDVDEKIAAFEERMEALRAENPDKYKRGRETQNVPYKVVKGHLKEHQVLIKRNGRTYVATINGNPRAAQALNGLTNPDVDQNGVVGNMLKLGTWVNRQLSAFYTTRNPDFVASNFFRDMLYSNCMTWVKESPRYALRFHKNFGRVNPITMRRLLGKWESGTLRDDDRLEHLFHMFMMNGGETGYTDVRDIEGHKRAIAAELRKQGSVGRRVWTALGMQLDLLNRSAENCARFAAFITSIEFGRTVGRAVYDAKEISVNFNKKGSGGKMVNAVGQTTLGKVGAYLGGSGRILYVFWNAGIQGMTNFGRQAKRHPAKFTAGATALFVLGYLMPILAKMLSGDDGDDDDKNAYYNLPEYIRRQNICLYAGEQWITIPLPIEFRAMYGLGELAHGVISGDEHYSNDELAFQMAAQVSQIMPLDMLEGGGGATPYIPSAAKPFTEAYIMNRDWTGLPVYKDTPFNKNDPEWTKAYASADTHLVDFARWLNEISGGDDYKKGSIDINPAKIEHVLSSTFGGVISFPNKLNKTGETIFGDREFEWRNIPIANRLVKSGDERTANRKLKNEYYKYREEYNATGSLLRKYENAEADGILGYAEKVNFMQNSPEYARWLVFDDFKDEIKAYQTDIAEATNAEERKQLEAQMYARMRELVNALHNPEEYLRDAVAAPQDASQEQSNS